MHPVLDLTDEGRAHAIVLGDHGLTCAERLEAIEMWRTRMVQEHISARVFAALVTQMMKASVAASYQAAVADMVAQELRHGRLCAGVIVSLGGQPVAELSELPDVPLHEQVSPLEGLLRNVLSISCISETTAVAEFAAERERLAPGPLRDLQQEILADEINHARFGWKLVEELAPGLDPQLRGRLTEYLVFALRQRIARAGGLVYGQPPSAKLAAFGAIDGPDMHALFIETMSQVVLPGLEACGLGAHEAWTEAVAGLTTRASAHGFANQASQAA